MAENVELLSRSTNPKKDMMCAICFEEMDETAARIECCQHRFCFSCIEEWATNQSNSCPICKKRFNKITYKNEKGKEKVKEVANRQIDGNEQEFFVC